MQRAEGIDDAVNLYHVARRQASNSPSNATVTAGSAGTAVQTGRPDSVANGDVKSKSGARQSPVAVSSSRMLRLVRFPISTGIVPLNWLSKSHRVLRLVRFPISTGIVPLNWLSLT